jgi:hypothetical protein
LRPAKWLGRKSEHRRTSGWWRFDRKGTKAGRHWCGRHGGGRAWRRDDSDGFVAVLHCGLACGGGPQVDENSFSSETVAHNVGVAARRWGAVTAQGGRAERGGGGKRGGETLLLLVAKAGDKITRHVGAVKWNTANRRHSRKPMGGDGGQVVTQGWGVVGFTLSALARTAHWSQFSWMGRLGQVASSLNRRRGKKL